MFLTLPLELKHLCLMIQHEGKGLCSTSSGPLADCMYYTHIAQEERALEEILIDSLDIFYCQWHANALTDAF